MKSAEPCRDSRGEIEADSELRDTENVPLGESIHRLLRARSPALRSRRLDQRNRARSQGWRDRQSRLRDQLQSLLLQVSAATAPEAIDDDIKVVEQDIVLKCCMRLPLSSDPMDIGTGTEPYSVLQAFWHRMDPRDSRSVVHNTPRTTDSSLA